MPAQQHGEPWCCKAAEGRLERSFEESMTELYPALQQRLALVVHDPEEARDLAQEAYLRAYRAWATFDGTDARGWLYTIGLRLAFNEVRRRSRWSRFLGAARSHVAAGKRA
jgi:RNA polymerase sigma-70 factor (ECF subfamily)